MAILSVKTLRVPIFPVFRTNGVDFARKFDSLPTNVSYYPARTKYLTTEISLIDFRAMRSLLAISPLSGTLHIAPGKRFLIRGQLSKSERSREVICMSCRFDSETFVVSFCNSGSRRTVIRGKHSPPITSVELISTGAQITFPKSFCRINSCGDGSGRKMSFIVPFIATKTINTTNIRIKRLPRRSSNV